MTSLEGQSLLLVIGIALAAVAIRKIGTRLIRIRKIRNRIVALDKARADAVFDAEIHRVLLSVRGK